MNRKTLLMAYFTSMLSHFGPSHWWPGETPFEVAVGAILTQNTAWKNVEKALESLKKICVLSPVTMAELDDSTLEKAIRPSGVYRIKTARLRNLLQWLASHHGWDNGLRAASLDFLQHKKTENLRTELLAISGIGPETADAILLYALNRPSFVVDAYTRRIYSRHGLVPSSVLYKELREFFMDALPQEVALYNEYHALIVRTGNTFCKKEKPLCSQCPLGVYHDHAAS